MDTGAVYSDFGQLASLKAQAQTNPNDALEDVAAQFESVFIQMMLKSMREATMKSDLFQSNQMDTYMAMADQQVALSMSEQGGIGIARMLVEQMQTTGMVDGGDVRDNNEQLNTNVTGSAERAMTLGLTGQAPKAFELPAAAKYMMNRED